MWRPVLVASLVSLLAVAALAGANGSPDRVPAGAAGTTAAPSGVSPGASGSFAAAAPCPTFSWTSTPGAAAYELQVYAVDERAQVGATPALDVRIPGGASSWTPAVDRCLAGATRFAWSVRAVAEESPGPWSEALLFETSAVPADLAAALAVLELYLGGEGAAGSSASVAAELASAAAGGGDGAQGRATAHEGDDGAIPLVGGPITAIRGEVPDGAGETYGVRGVSNSAAGAGVRADNNNASGADLLLGGAPAASLTETTFSRNSASDLTFNFTNPGAGSMTLQADGSNLMTAAAGSALWVDQAGDTMAGTLGMGGNPITSVGDLALNTASTVTKGGQRFLYDDPGTASFAAGRGALANNTGNFNTALGTAALAANTSGRYNTAVGSGALDSSTTANYNVAVGDYALASNTTGGSNVAVGDLAMGSNTGGTSNVAVGQHALLNNTTGSYSTAVGAGALEVATADSNTAVGRLALGSTTTGVYNTAVGLQALGANTTADGNTAVGDYAMRFNTTGFQNVAVGQYALRDNTMGYGNIAVGTHALRNNTTGAGNVAVGFATLYENTLGNGNIAIGDFAGFYATGGGSIFIGNSGSGAENNEIRIGSFQTATYIAGISGQTAAGGVAVFVNGAGKLGTSTSSRRFKEDIAEVGEASEALFDLRPVSFRYTAKAASAGAERPLEYGLIAEEVAEVWSELVAYDEKGRPETVRYHLLVPLLLNELQRERERGEGQERRLEALEAELRARAGPGPPRR